MLAVAIVAIGKLLKTMQECNKETMQMEYLSNQEQLAQNRLLIISISNAIRQSKVTAMIRNKYVCEIAHKVLSSE